MNTSFRRAPWADILYAMDAAWWRAHLAEVRRVFAGGLLTIASDVPGVRRTNSEHFGNSGAGAVALADRCGADRVILLGYDAQRTDGRAHWHADHPRGLGNAGSVGRWGEQFASLADSCRARVVNASRATALACFARVDLGEALAARC